MKFKRKKGYAVIFLLMGVVAIIVSIGGLYFLQQLPTSIKFQNTNFSDPDTNIYFAERQTLFSVNLNRGLAKKLHTFEDKITKVELFPNTKELYIETEIEKEGKRITDGWSIRMNGQELTKLSSKIFDVQRNKWLQYAIDETIDAKLNAYTTHERIYSGESKNGFVEILSNKFDSKLSIRIGTINQSSVKNRVGYSISPNRQFFPSFDGSYLFENGPAGGGLGHPLLAISRDGKYIYNIDSNVFGSGYVWLGDNNLLAQNQIGLELFTLYPNGKFDKEMIDKELQGGIWQGGLSPNRKYLAYYNLGSLYILITDKARRANEQKDLILVEQYKDDKSLREEFNLKSNLRLKHDLMFLGWNKKSNKLLYGSSKNIWAIKKDTKRGNYVDQKNLKLELKIADILENKTYTIATLDSADKNAFSTIVIY